MSRLKRAKWQYLSLVIAIAMANGMAGPLKGEEGESRFRNYEKLTLF